jgi:galactokinase
VTPAEWVPRTGLSDDVRRASEAFLASVAGSELFAHDREIVIARAPGRLDVIGGVADYSGSLVLEWPLADATFAAIQRDARPVLSLVSGTRCAKISLEELLSLDYANAAAHFAADPATRWTAYVAGAFIVLAQQGLAEFRDGARILIASTVPEGKGVSSSAALEVATMSAICPAYGITIEPRGLAVLCQTVENLIAGAPCGVMDQMSSALGQCGRLLALLCQPAQVQSQVGLPSGFALWGIDSGVRHAVSGIEYAVVRAAAFMGRRILEDLGGHTLVYLTHLTPAEFTQLAPRLPERLTGRTFLDRYGATADLLTSVDPELEYPVRAAAAHAIHEHARARAFADRLASCEDAERAGIWRLEQEAASLGALMYESHDSYSACGLGSDSTDALVALLQQAGPESGVYGAKVTGAGRGGTVAVFGRTTAGPLVRTIAARYARRSGLGTRVFAGSSSGAASCGVCHLYPWSAASGACHSLS